MRFPSTRFFRGRMATECVGLVLFVFMLYTPPLGAHIALDSYQGSATCKPCHPDKPRELQGTVHYLLKGPTPEVPELVGFAGKLGSINDFETLPDINWLFTFSNPVTGEREAGGCAVCHVGMGLKPSQDPTRAQLDNIDCLMCHSPKYQRTVESVQGDLRFVPDPSISIPVVTKAIQARPALSTCLNRCHAGADGGPGTKQGDMARRVADRSESLDVHLSKEGAGLHCLDCHVVRGHKFAGRGNDLRPTDLSKRLECTNCHSLTPHSMQYINKHTARVNCTVCHIPTYARYDETDVYRDFSGSEVDEKTQRYEPLVKKRKALMPVYKFWNRQSFFYKFGDPINIGSDGRFLLAGPLGNIRDCSVKLNAFKHHRAFMGYDPDSLRLLPLKTKVMWQTGNMEEAYKAGAESVGWTLSRDVSFVKTDRYMALFHQVAPANKALWCGHCHVDAGRIDFKALGYGVKDRLGNERLCASCHELKDASFLVVHDEHVDKLQFDCTICHLFQVR